MDYKAEIKKHQKKLKQLLKLKHQQAIVKRNHAFVIYAYECDRGYVGHRISLRDTYFYVNPKKKKFQKSTSSHGYQKPQNAEWLSSPNVLFTKPQALTFISHLPVPNVVKPMIIHDILPYPKAYRIERNYYKSKKVL